MYVVCNLSAAKTLPSLVPGPCVFGLSWKEGCGVATRAIHLGVGSRGGRGAPSVAVRAHTYNQPLSELGSNPKTGGLQPENWKALAKGTNPKTGARRLPEDVLSEAEQSGGLFYGRTHRCEARCTRRTVPDYEIDDAGVMDYSCRDSLEFAVDADC